MTRYLTRCSAPSETQSDTWKALNAPHSDALRTRTAGKRVKLGGQTGGNDSASFPLNKLIGNLRHYKSHLVLAVLISVISRLTQYSE